MARAWIAEVDQHPADERAVDRHLAVLDVPGGHVVEVLEHRLGRHLVVVRVEEAHAREAAVQLLGVAVHRRADGADLGVEVLASHALGHAEVDERNAPVIHQPVVAGVGVPREMAVPVERPEEEAEDDLAEAVARRPVELLHLLEADPVDPLGHKHVLGAELGHDARDVDERVVAPGAGEGAVLLRLVLVVELVGEPLADLGRHRLGVHAGRDPLGHAHDQPQVLEVRPAPRCPTPGYCTLTATSRPSSRRAR